MSNNLFDLSGKSAVVTGATGLLGSAFCEGLAMFGCRVAVCDIDKEKCDKSADNLKNKFGLNCIGIKVDVSDKKSVEKMVDQVVNEFDRIDVLVTSHQNKTANFFDKFEEYSERDWEAIMDVNLKGVFLCCQAVGKQMLKQGGGSIINIASTYGVVAPNHEIYEGTKLECPAAYSASKGGVIALTKYLATYWGEKKIRVNAISPHGVFNNHEKRFVENFSKKSPLKRMSLPREVVGALVFLASDASSYVTGHNLMVDGGWTSW